MDLGVHEQASHEVDDGDRRSVLGSDDRRAPAGRVRAAEVRRSEDAVGPRQQRLDIAVPPDVIPGRHDVGAAREEPLGELRRQACPVGRVLAVHDAERDAQLVAQLLEARLDGTPARHAEDICDEEDPQGTDRLTAGRTSRWTCWPRSRV